MRKINRSLNEAFSESMPHWLRGYLLHQLKGDSRFKNPVDQGYDFNKYTSMSHKDYMINQLSKEQKLVQSLPLYTKLQNAGIDLTQAKFNNVAPPQDKNDPVLSKNNSIFKDKLFFYRLVWEDVNSHLQKEQVWCRGLNDYEIFEARGKRERLGGLPSQASVFFEYVEDICYIEDITSNKQDFTKLAQRSTNNRFYNLEPDEEGNSISRDQLISRRFDPNINVTIGDNDYYTDKSGYISGWTENFENTLEDTLAKAKYLKYSANYLPKKLKRPVVDIYNQLLKAQKMYKKGIVISLDRFDDVDNLPDKSSNLVKLRELLRNSDFTMRWIDYMSTQDSGILERFIDWLCNKKDWDSWSTMCYNFDIEDHTDIPKCTCYTIPKLQDEFDSLYDACKDGFYTTITFPIQKDN